MQMLGIHWSGAPQAAIEPLRAAVLALRRPDGGWAQTPRLASDAYATGLALSALAECGHPPQSPEYREGIRFLLRTQAADGSWHVASRAPKFQPYFEGGFPYAHDQWISQWATGWAAIALAQALPETKAAGSLGRR
jgi:squalene cyclase